LNVALRKKTPDPFFTSEEMEMKKIDGLTMVSLLFAAVLAGCSEQQTTQIAPKPAAESEPADGSMFVLAAEPDGAGDVSKVRESTDDEVVVVGRIGGSQNPWVEGRAAFSIVDTALVPCNEREDDDCPYPWDYCCDTDKLPTSTALVKFVDDAGSLIKSDARELLNVKELQTVVVRGAAKRDEAGNLTVLASGVFVRD
jgi:hypothetical protein